MVIGLVGYKQSGKDTVAGVLIKDYGFEHRAFAYPIKQAVSALFDIPFSEIDKLKNDSSCFVTVWAGSDTLSNFTFRELLQRFGTEMGREIFGEEFWVDITLPVGGFYSGRAIVISDVRFQTEIDRIHAIGGKIVRVDRPGLDHKDPHSSERIEDLEGIDMVLKNNGTVEDLNDVVSTTLVALA